MNTTPESVPAPAPEVIDRASAMKAHARWFHAYVCCSIESLHEHTAPVDINRATALAAAIESERRFADFLLASLETQRKALVDLVEEACATRAATSALLAVLLRQGSVDRAQLQIDYAKEAERLFGGAEKVPVHRRDIALSIAGHAPDVDLAATAH
jgi:hypothetical protein